MRLIMVIARCIMYGLFGDGYYRRHPPHGENWKLTPHPSSDVLHFTVIRSVF